MLTLTVSGTPGDYADTSNLRQRIATAAGVDDASLVTISVAAGSVIITATIAVPASTTLGLASSSRHRPVPPPTSATALTLASTALALASTALATARRRCHNVAFTATISLPIDPDDVLS